MEKELIKHFENEAFLSSSSSFPSLLVEATSHPSLFAFSELLALRQLQETRNLPYLRMLRLFVHGTWKDYKSNADNFPELMPEQILKLKQLTVLTLAHTNKVLHYDQLMEEIDVTDVRELEDFLIDDCLYAGIVRGKLNHLQRCFEVHYAAERDLRPGQLVSMTQMLSDWLSTTESLLISFQKKINWADKMNEIGKKHKKDVEEKVKVVKKSLSKKLVTPSKQDDNCIGGHKTYSEFDRGMDCEEDRILIKRYSNILLSLSRDDMDQFAEGDL